VRPPRRPALTAPSSRERARLWRAERTRLTARAARAGAADDIVRRTRLLENEIRVLKDESTRLNLEQEGNKEKVKDNLDKIKLNRQLPYLVGNIVEVLDQVPEARSARRARAPKGTARETLARL
jgi:ATP-dependent 26S proteasome regulatory subunit